MEKLQPGSYFPFSPHHSTLITLHSRQTPLPSTSPAPSTGSPGSPSPPSSPQFANQVLAQDGDSAVDGDPGVQGGQGVPGVPGDGQQQLNTDGPIVNQNQLLELPGQDEVKTKESLLLIHKL